MIDAFIIGCAVLMAAFATLFLTLWLRLRMERRERMTRKSEKIVRRVSKISGDALPLWCEQALGETGRAFSSWRSTGDPAHLEEAIVGAKVLAEILEHMGPTK